jgi:hypothetical protein
MQQEAQGRRLSFVIMQWPELASGHFVQTAASGRLRSRAVIDKTVGTS